MYRFIPPFMIVLVPQDSALRVVYAIVQLLLN